jgi:hypothetical protein
MNLWYKKKKITMKDISLLKKQGTKAKHEEVIAGKPFAKSTNKSDKEFVDESKEGPTEAPKEEPQEELKKGIEGENMRNNPRSTIHQRNNGFKSQRKKNK